ncbi:hypothetical protein GCM10011363_30180 [Marivita lacus]|uniref:Uncharacterized protein n=1 Tax=Marivita lacus TaxID=1323742 RepID=A0ABQ1KYE2_9RHOB|nr:hypothetical protein GCM10011363_30180 [Marivita lacus]
MSEPMLRAHDGRYVGKTDISEIGSVILQTNGSLTVVLCARSCDVHGTLPTLTRILLGRKRRDAIAKGLQLEIPSDPEERRAAVRRWCDAVRRVSEATPQTDRCGAVRGGFPCHSTRTE